VPYPGVGPRDLGVSRAQWAAALGQANTRIVKGNECNAQVRALYSAKQ
jgi:hypothetical protein